MIAALAAVLAEGLIWAGVLALVLAGASTVALWSWGHFARQALGLPSVAIPAGTGAPLDHAIPDGPDAAALVTDPAEALALRMDSAEGAARGIDVMTYIWSEDRSGRALAAALIQAAGRGVRVRLLLDDVNLLGRDPLWLALDRTAGIEVRIFNPVRERASALRRGIELLLVVLRYNRRMHGKMWLADGRLAILGGRNVGDAYFGLATGRERNVADADLLLTGPVVARVAEEFDAFWNSDLALPIAALWRGRLPRLPRLRRYRRRRAPAEAAVPEAPGLAAALARRRAGGQVKLIADPPDKALGARRSRVWLPERLAPVLAGARHELRLVSPYLVPGRDGMAQLLALAGRGVRVRVLTNALAVIDHAAVHGAYRWYRGRLLAAGVGIHEFCAPRGAALPEMLHAKAALVDGRVGFVGSFNFDQRSAWLNTETGVLFDDPALLADLAAWIDAASAPERAYAVTRQGRFTRWQRGAGKPRGFEPQTRLARRALAFVIGHLPIHRLL
jgi:putative cardiolipin synthase